MDLAPGDVLICYSDGISEATNTVGELWEENELEQLLRQSARAPASELVENIVRAADNFAAGADQADDMTVVALRIL